jgi:lipopolysaccharide exporter
VSTAEGKKLSDDLNRKTIKNIGYNSLSRFWIMIFQFAGNIILSRILVASDYGIVAFAMIFINFLTQFSDFGINSAIIQDKLADDSKINTAFAMKIGISVLIVSAGWIIAPLSGYMTDQKVVSDVIRLLSFNFLISVFCFLPSVYLTKRLDYKKLAVNNILTQCINTGAAIVLVLNGFSFWSIVYANIISTLFSAVLYNIQLPVHPRIVWNQKASAEIFGFSWHVFASGFIGYVLVHADNLLVGTYKGAGALGYYCLAFTWATLIAYLLKMIAGSVFFPTFSQILHDKVKLGHYYRASFQYICLITLVANAMLLLVSRELLFVILGKNTDKWLPALDTLRILLVYGTMRGMSEAIAPLLIATGETRFLLKVSIFAIIIEIVAIYPAAIMGTIETVAIAVTVSYLPVFYLYIRKAAQLMDQTIWESLKVILPYVFISGIFVCVLYAIDTQIHTTLLSFIQKTIVGLIAYFALLVLCTRGRIVQDIYFVIRSLRH